MPIVNTNEGLAQRAVNAQELADKQVFKANPNHFLSNCNAGESAPIQTETDILLNRIGSLQSRLDGLTADLLAAHRRLYGNFPTQQTETIYNDPAACIGDLPVVRKLHIGLQNLETTLNETCEIVKFLHQL